MYQKSRALLAAGVALATLSAASAEAPVGANIKYNGAWKVAMVTEIGVCDRSYHYGVAIENGSINYKPTGGDDQLNLSGRVDGIGRVQVVMVKGVARAAAIGQLQLSSGSGTWQVPTLGCTGRWSAARL